MIHLSDCQMVSLLACGVGALHVLGPDHWLPSSILTWQKRWGTWRTLLFTGVTFFAHVLAGYLLFLVFHFAMSGLGLSQFAFFMVALVWVAGFALFRGLRFKRIREVFRTSQSRMWAMLAVFSLLGPCEVVLPIFVKARELGVGYLLPFTWFLVGTWISGVTLVFWGQWVCSRPMGLPLGLRWSHRKASVLPMLGGLTLCIGFLLI